MSTSSTPPMAVKSIECDPVSGLIAVEFKKDYQPPLFMGFVNFTRVTVAPPHGIAGTLKVGTLKKGSTSDLQIDAAHYTTISSFAGPQPSFTMSFDYDTATRAVLSVTCASLAAAAPAAE